MQNTIPVKCYLNSGESLNKNSYEIRRFDHDASGTYRQLNSKILSSYGNQIPSGAELKLTWLDNEHEQITFTNDSELEYAINYQLKNKKKRFLCFPSFKEIVLQIYIRVLEKPVGRPKNVPKTAAKAANKARNNSGPKLGFYEVTPQNKEHAAVVSKQQDQVSLKTVELNSEESLKQEIQAIENSFLEKSEKEERILRVNVKYYVANLIESVVRENNDLA